MRLLGALSYLQTALSTPKKPGAQPVSFDEVFRWLDSFNRLNEELRDGKKVEAKLSPEEWQIVQAYHLLPSKENVRAFMQAARENEKSALGPGCEEDPAEVTRLQESLKHFGFAVEVHGEYDQKTMEAVQAFKRAHGLHEAYRMEDGAWAVNEYATQDTMAVIAGRRRLS